MEKENLHAIEYWLNLVAKEGVNSALVGVLWDEESDLSSLLYDAHSSLSGIMHYSRKEKQAYLTQVIADLLRAAVILKRNEV